jgi:hypothetical protein
VSAWEKSEKKERRAVGLLRRLRDEALVLVPVLDGVGRDAVEDAFEEGGCRRKVEEAINTTRQGEKEEEKQTVVGGGVAKESFGARV